MINSSTSPIKVQAIRNYQLLECDIVKTIKQGDKYMDIYYKEKETTSAVKRIDADHYEIIRTGEICEYEHGEEKSKRSLKRTFEELRWLIRTNFTDCSQSQLFITLTYAENMKDPNRLYDDFNKFMKRLKYNYKGHKFDYIVVAEPQGRGAWHMHLMLKSDQPILYIENKKLEKIWGHGMTDAERLMADDIGAYYVAYFTDILPKDGSSNKKAKKGSRLHFYPPHFRFYRTSRGIARPEKGSAFYADVIDDYGEPEYVQQYEIQFSEDNWVTHKVLNRCVKQTHLRD